MLFIFITLIAVSVMLALAVYLYFCIRKPTMGSNEKVRLFKNVKPLQFDSQHSS